MSTLDPSHDEHLLLMSMRKIYDDSQSINNSITKSAEKQTEETKYWRKLAALMMNFLTSIPREVYEALKGL
jgi:hypothetical protein